MEHGHLGGWLGSSEIWTRGKSCLQISQLDFELSFESIEYLDHSGQRGDVE